MALVLVATPGAPNANSYATVADGNAYHEAHLYASTWNAGSTTDEKKAQALVWATRLLDEHIDWFGTPSTSSQALRWPRAGMGTQDGLSIGGDVIPAKLKEATIELARLLIDADLTVSGGGSSGGAVEELKVGPIGIKFEGAVSATVDTIPDSVFFIVRQWGMVRSRTGGAIPLYRV